MGTPSELSWDAAAASEVPPVCEAVCVTEAKTSANDVPSGYKVADDARAPQSELAAALALGAERGAKDAMRV